MRRQSLWIVLLILLCLTAGCAKQSAVSGMQTALPEERAEKETTTAEPEKAQESPKEPETLFEGDFGDPCPAEQSVEDGDYYLIDDLEEGFVEVYDEYVFLDAAQSPLLEVGGLKEPADNYDEYYRLDAGKKEIYSYFNEAYAADSSGGTIRFRTDADRIAVDMKLYAVGDFPHISDRGSFGIDIYTGTGTDRRYCGARMQFLTDDEELYDIIELPGGYQEVLIELPQYAGVVNFRVGFPEGSYVAAPTKRSSGAILFYGSSVTQGASASRPGNAYTNILCRALDCDCINLGFSGSDLGEQEIAEYIAARDFDIFVMDYNNNASVEILEDTHYDFYKTVRSAKPDIPILMLCKPYFTKEPDDECRQKESIILDTVRRAESEGDENVYFISAADYFPMENRDLCCVDMVHPNDLGHYYMAKAIFPVLYDLLTDESE